MEQQLSYLEQIDRRRIRPDDDIPPHDFLFRWNDKPCFARGELVALTGKAKSGKTYLGSILLSLAVRDEFLGLCRHHPDQSLRVLWCDTEQSEDTTCEILRDRVGALIGAVPDDEHYAIYNFRQINWQDRLSLIEKAIVMYQPDLVLFDGIRDVVGDINDYTEAQNVISRLLSLASYSKACIVCVLHQNKALEDKTLRGALGTELQNKSFETYECQKDPDSRIFTVRQTATRKYDIPGKLCFSVDKNGLPVSAFFPDETEEKSLPDIRTIFTEVLGSSELRAGDLEGRMIQRYHLSRAQYGELRMAAQRTGLIQRREVSDREVWYSLAGGPIDGSPQTTKDTQQTIF